MGGAYKPAKRAVLWAGTIPSLVISGALPGTVMGRRTGCSSSNDDVERAAPKAITAPAPKRARLVDSLCKHGRAYVPPQGLDAYASQYRARKVTTMAKQAKALG